MIVKTCQPGSPANLSLNEIRRQPRGSPADWAQRFLDYRAKKEAPAQPPVEQPSSAPKPTRKRQVSALRQFQILSGRNLKIIFQDKVTLGLMLALAPLQGLMNFIWGDDLFDPVTGKAAKILVVWFMSAIIAILVGSLRSSITALGR